MTTTDDERRVLDEIDALVDWQLAQRSGRDLPLPPRSVRPPLTEEQRRTMNLKERLRYANGVVGSWPYD